MGDAAGTAATDKVVSFAPFHGYRRRAAVKRDDTGTTGRDLISYMYFLRTREHRLLGKPVYKVGRTTQEPDTIIKRLRGYTKGSEVLCVVQCPNEFMDVAEKSILEQFRGLYGPGPDGNEDFVLPTLADVIRGRRIVLETVQRCWEGMEEARGGGR